MFLVIFVWLGVNHLPLSHMEVDHVERERDGIKTYPLLVASFFWDKQDRFETCFMDCGILEREGKKSKNKNILYVSNGATLKLTLSYSVNHVFCLPH